MHNNKSYILVAEDDKFYDNIFEIKLQSEGFEVKIVRDGQQALDEISKRKPDLLLLDLVMPIKDGFDVLSTLKEKGLIDKLKVVVLSNLGQAEDIQKAKNLGAKDYLVKADFSIQETIEKIKSYLK